MPATPASTEVEGNWPQRFIQCGGDAVTYRIDVWPRSIDGQSLCAVAFVPLAGVRGVSHSGNRAGGAQADGRRRRTP